MEESKYILVLYTKDLNPFMEGRRILSWREVRIF